MEQGVGQTELGVDQTKVNLQVGLRCCNHWKNLAAIPLQAFPLILLDAEVYYILQAVVAQPEGVVLYAETVEKSKWNVHHFTFK